MALSRSSSHERSCGERSDESLVEAIRRSDEAAFTILYERYYTRVYNYAFLRFRNHADSEEVVQETFTAVFRSIESFGGRSSVLAWIFGIAKHTVNNTIRRAVGWERRLNQFETEWVRSLRPSTACTPEDELTLRRCAESVRGRFEALPAWQAEIFELRHVENLPIAEISKRTSRSNDAVRSSLCRIKRMVVSAVDCDDWIGVGSVSERSLA